MAKKKVLITVIIAVALICVVAVAGTLAYLTAKSNNGNGVTNTFVAAGEGKLIEDPEDGGLFEVQETPVERNESTGKYEANPSSSKVGSGITYNFVPGEDLPKDASLVVNGKTEVPANLFVEVVENLPSTLFDWSIDTTNWTEVTGIKGLNGGKVYVYTQSGKPVVLDDTTGSYDVNILKNKKVAVKDVDEATISSAVSTAAGSDFNIKFYGYMCQSIPDKTPAQIFTACEFVKTDK